MFMRLLAALLVLPLAFAQAQDIDKARWKQNHKGTWVQVTDDDCRAGTSVDKNAVEACGIWSSVQQEADARRERERRSLLPAPAIGMTTKQVLERTSAGPPNKVNRTVTKNHLREQWVYNRGVYLYFDNGVLTAFQD